MKKIILYIPFFLILFASCEEKIDLELNEGNQRLVVEASLKSRDTIQQVKLSKTASYFTDEQTPRVTGANVYISDDSTTYSFSEVSPGKYHSNIEFGGSPRSTYTLNISLDNPIDGKTTYTASETMPTLLVLDSIKAEPLPQPMGGQDTQVKAYGQEPAQEKNYYMWDLYVNGKQQTDTLSEKTFTDDALVNGSYIPGLPIFFYNGSVDDTISVHTQSITKSYYDFLLAFIQEAQFGGGNFSGPPANVEGNISGGALGYFSVKAVSRTRTIY